MSVTALAAARVRELVAEWPADPAADAVYRLLRMLGTWRAQMLANTFIAHQGAVIWSGPFAGMQYVRKTTEGALIPRLLGTYESELHPHLAAFAEAGLDCVIDVGCAEGYYAVGLARMMPQTRIVARDIDPAALTACAELAARNGVAERVEVGGEFRPEDFAAFAGKHVLVMVDVEGAELDILRPDLAPALAGMNIIVETHFRRDTVAQLQARFAATHDIVRVDQQPKTFTMPPWMQELNHLDQLLAVWEWRMAPTPWLVMRPKAGG